MVLVYFAPIFILFDIFQLVAAERFIGIKQIRAGKHPANLDRPGPPWVAVFWIFGILALWTYMVLLFMSPRGGVQGFIMVTASLLGYALRKVMGVKFALVILTFEAAVRMGLLANYMISALLWQGLPLPPSFYQ